MMGTAFLGYVLPYGQMSLWGRTVITNMLSAIPWIGGDFVEFVTNLLSLMYLGLLHIEEPCITIGIITTVLYFGSAIFVENLYIVIKQLFAYFKNNYIIFIYLLLFIVIISYNFKYNVAYCASICPTHDHSLITKYCTIPCPGGNLCNVERVTLFQNVANNINQRLTNVTTQINNVNNIVVQFGNNSRAQYLAELRELRSELDWDHDNVTDLLDYYNNHS
jgi:hypothetical protein